MEIIISSDPPKMAMLDSQQYPLKLCLVNYELYIHFKIIQHAILIFDCDFSAKVTCALLQENY